MKYKILGGEGYYSWLIRQAEVSLRPYGNHILLTLLQ
jgi:hypothetical protein